MQQKTRFAECSPTIQGVSEQRMPRRGKMRANLMPCPSAYATSHQHQRQRSFKPCEQLWGGSGRKGSKQSH